MHTTTCVTSGKERVEEGGQLSDALRHVQWRQHLFKDGALHVGAPQVGLLQVAAGQVTVLQQINTRVLFLPRFGPIRDLIGCRVTSMKGFMYQRVAKKYSIL